MQARAVQEVQAMHDRVEAQMQDIERLSRDLQKADDRIGLLVDERNRLRKESNTYRSKLVELATAMTNINLLTGAATEIMNSVRETIEHVDGEAPALEPNRWKHD
jgi:uncharacterized coiled-coil DUF342 family protein